MDRHCTIRLPADRHTCRPTSCANQAHCCSVPIPTWVEVSIALRTSQAIWAALVVRYFILAGRPTSCPAHDVQARLSDVCVVLLAPLPFSIWFTPYHAVVLLPANMLLLTVALGNDRSLWARRAAAAALVGCQILQYAIQQWELRGATSLASFVLIVLALGMVRSDSPKAMESPAKGARIKEIAAVMRNPATLVNAANLLSHHRRSCPDGVLDRAIRAAHCNCQCAARQ